jgi:hypothetical protein
MGLDAPPVGEWGFVLAAEAVVSAARVLESEGGLQGLRPYHSLRSYPDRMACRAAMLVR